MGFPQGFRWGVATAAYQVEGAYAEGGRGLSVWDTFSHQPGRIVDGSTGDVACDHYHRYREDVALMAALGVNAYRFSISWPRVRPDGSGAVNPAGLAFYDRLVDTLLENGIDPVATLYHWDLPQALQDAGGWMSRDTVYRFAEYADIVAGALGDRVSMWITLNEPAVVLMLGYATGIHAPGERLMFGGLPVAHHLLLAHGLAVGALRARGAETVGVTNNYSPVWQRGDAEADLLAVEAYDAVHNRLMTDPLFGRGYPELKSLRALGLDPATLDLPVRDGDLETIAAPLSFLGVNYYNPVGIRAAVPGEPMPFEMVPLDEYPVTAFGWPVVPEGLTELLVGLRDRYGSDLPPIHVTENGAAYDDAVIDGVCDDPKRVAYLTDHIRAVGDAIAAGVDVRGYFAWSLMDNFEWAEGYTKRFGLVHVDFETLVRTPKSSYAAYRQLIAKG